MGNNILAIGLAHAPALTNTVAEMLIPCVLALFFSNVGIDLPITQIANVSPNCDTIGNIISDVGANVVTEIQAKLERVSSIFLACDKGNKKNDSYFVKILCWWDHTGKKVDKFVLDVDGAEGSSQDAATSIDRSLRKIDNNNGIKRRKLKGFCTDAGGGGTGISFGQCLAEKGRLADLYSFSTCAIHGLQRSLAVPVEVLCGKAGLHKDVLLQLLFTVFCLQSKFDEKEWHLIWFRVNGKELEEPLPLPTLTRWWHVGNSGLHMNGLWVQWFRVGTAILDGHDAKSMKSELASWLICYMKNLPIKVQLEFMVNFHTAWFCCHMKWMQAKDQITQQPGLRSHHMPVRAYVMHSKMNDIITNWTVMPKFQ